VFMKKLERWLEEGETVVVDQASEGAASSRWQSERGRMRHPLCSTSFDVAEQMGSVLNVRRHLTWQSGGKEGQHPQCSMPFVEG